MNLSHRSRRKAFTLIEMLVVIAIVGILFTLVVPTIEKARRNALRMNCASNLRQVGMAVKMYLMDHNNVFPPLEPADKFGALATYYLPYLNGATAVFRCPAQKNNLPSIYGERLYIPGQSYSNAWVGYEFNAFFAYATTGSYIRTLSSRDVNNASICAYAFDYPYNTNIVADAPYIPHQGGMNVLYLDWHVNWLEQSQYQINGKWFFEEGRL
jgi:prepilin-type N-terminal cleavage/methylation domain-containing protein/prepilin-type processing-associated H-X9-DG protein